MSAGYFKLSLYVIIALSVASVTCAPSGENPRTTTVKSLPKKGLTWNNVTTDNVTSHTVLVASDGNLRINPGDMSHYLRCTTCLTECVKVRRSAIGYFFCTNCIRSCVNNLDSFMHFFSSHKCTFVNEGGSDPTSSIPSQVLGDYLWDSSEAPDTPTDVRQTPNNERSPNAPRPTPIAYNKAANQGTGNNFDYLDQYISNNVLQNSGCSEIKKKYENISTEYAQCHYDLNNCRSGWDVNYGYGDYGGDYGSQLGIQTTTAPPLPTQPQDNIFNLIKKLESNIAHVMESILPLTQNITGVPRYVQAHVVEDPYQKILEKHKTRFMSIAEFETLSQREWDYVPTVASLKSVLRRNNNYYLGERERKTPVCPAAYKIISPRKAIHHTGRYGVEIARIDNKNQVQTFFVAQCRFSKPTVKLHRNAICDEVTGLFKALFIVGEEEGQDPNSGIANCKPFDDGRYYCDDWVRLNSSCSLYLN